MGVVTLILAMNMLPRSTYREIARHQDISDAALCEDGPVISGSTHPAYDGVQDVFAEVVDHLPGTGAAFAVWHRGEYVVDLWGGWADGARTRPFVHDSLVMPYSVSKPFAAACVLVLVDRGLLSLDDDVRTYWPELSTETTVRQLLCHQSGLVYLDNPAPTELFFDWDGMCDVLARQPPAWPPGTAHGESALLYGHPLGQLVRRIDGRTLGQFLQEEICGPLGLDFRIGLPDAEHARAVEMTGFETVFGPDGGDRSPMFERALLNPPGALDGDIVNSAAWRRAEIPAINGFGTARAVAGFYAGLASGGVLSPSLLSDATSRVSVGVDRVVGIEGAWGLGFGVDEDGFGMGGLGGHLGWWSTSGEYAIGYVSGSLGGYEPLESLESGVRDALGLPSL
jgi:CubicO group peptidase (beta-lactamase class C family)